MKPQHRLAPLVRPRSVAVFGASPRPGTLGQTTVANLKQAGFPGAVYPIHMSAFEVEGLACYRSLGDLPETPDCVVAALGADNTLAGHCHGKC